MKIKIKENEYEVKNNMKAMLVFEGMTEKPFELKTLTDICQYEFCMLYANNDGFSMDFNDFLEALEDENVSNAFLEVLNNGKPEIGTKKKTTKGQK